MNNVSWRRILQSAGNEYSGEDGDTPPERQERRLPEPYDSYTSQSKWRQGGKTPSELEAQLRRSLDRPYNHDAAPRHQQENWDPIFLAQELENPAHQPPHRAKQAPNVQHTANQYAAKKGGTGVRNILAISLSAAVVGLAVQQIGAQWSQSNETAIPEINAASVGKMGKYDAQLDQSGYAVQAAVRPQPVSEPRQIAAVEALPAQAFPDRLDDTDSQAEAPPAATDNLDAEIAKAAEIFALREQEAREAAAREEAANRRSQLTPTAAPPQRVTSGASDLAEVVPLSPDEEQRLLERGRKLLSGGDVSSARLLFENLAMRESAFGAFALAQTYDTNFLRSLPNNLGVKGDQALAEKWYGRAVSLGERAGLAN